MVKIYKKELLKAKEDISYLCDAAPAFGAGFSRVALDLHSLVQCRDYPAEEP